MEGRGGTGVSQGRPGSRWRAPARAGAGGQLLPLAACLRTNTSPTRMSSSVTDPPAEDVSVIDAGVVVAGAAGSVTANRPFASAGGEVRLAPRHNTVMRAPAASRPQISEGKPR